MQLPGLLQAQLDSAAALLPALTPAQVYGTALGSLLGLSIVALLRRPDMARDGDTQSGRDMALRVAALRQERREAYLNAGLPVPGAPNLASTSQDVQSVFSTDPYGTPWRSSW